MRASVAFSLAAGLCLSAGVAPAVLGAQDVEALGRREGTRPPPGYYLELARNPQAFQFRNAWISRARTVFAERARLRRSADVDALNAAFAGGRASRAAASAAGTAVAGTYMVPVLLGGFSNITSTVFDSVAYKNKLFGTAAAPPYTVSTFYSEISRGLITLTGEVVGWFATDSADTFYEGPCQGLCTDSAHIGEFLKELFVHFDSILDFSLFDNDGPDGTPNSGDDDGVVDFVAVIFPEIGGNCSNSSTNIWPHRFVYRAWPASGGSPFTTGDARAGGGFITIDDYIIQGGVGGSTSCGSTNAIMPIGVFAHETGHAFGLPDLYDTAAGTYGVGNWELMAAAGLDFESPAHMSSWTLDQLGWINVDTLLGSSTFRSFDISPVQTSDTVFALCTAADPAQCFAQEFFYLENRQLLKADTTSIPGAGLLIFHTDPARIGDCSVSGSRCSSNTVNVEPLPGYDLEEADGLRQLNNHNNNGDANDPFPGAAGTFTTFGTTTNPPSVFNDSTPTNILVDSIAQNPDGSVHVAVNYATVQELIRTNVGGTSVIVDGGSFASPFSTVWVIGESHTIAVDSVQNSAPGTRHFFQSWSDAGARSHAVTATAIPDTFTATLNTEHRLVATFTGMGTITSSMPLDTAGTVWIAEGLVDSLTAAADSGFTFIGWIGDTISAADTLVLTMTKPYSVVARFVLPVAIVSDSLLTPGVMGAIYVDTLAATGGTGTYTWTLLSGAVPAGIVLDTTGVLSGVPAEAGDFTFTARAQSDTFTAEQAFGISVTKPTLALDVVLDHLLTSASTLTSDETRFLDLLGNANGGFDVGDLRAWLIDLGMLSPAVAAADGARAGAGPPGAPDAGPRSDAKTPPQPGPEKKGDGS